jgi:hypothetical protein
MQTAERAAVIGSPDLESLTTCAASQSLTHSAKSQNEQPTQIDRFNRRINRFTSFILDCSQLSRVVSSKGLEIHFNESNVGALQR